jgi:hypothetical protein
MNYWFYLMHLCELNVMNLFKLELKLFTILFDASMWNNVYDYIKIKIIYLFIIFEAFGEFNVNKYLKN